MDDHRAIGIPAIVRSAAAYGFLTLYLAIVGPPVILMARLFGAQGLVFTAGLFGLNAALRLSGIRHHLEGRTRMPADRSAVYCINHSSYLDVVAFAALYPWCRRLRVLHKAELGKLPILGQVCSLAGFIPIERREQDAAFHALERGTAALRQGVSILTAPEGTRSLDGTLQPFKKGVFVMAINAQAPVVPVAVLGATRALLKGRWLIQPGEIVVRIGDALETAGCAYDDRVTVMDDVHRRIEALLGKGRP